MTVVRRESARFFEALIWSRMYGFSVADWPGAVDNPPTAGQTGKPPFTTIKPALQDYPEFREPAVKRLTEVPDSLFRRLPVGQ